MKVTSGPGEGFEGVVRGVTAEGHYRVELPNIREGDREHGQGRVTYLLGSWWTQSAATATCASLPLVNLQPRKFTPPPRVNLQPRRCDAPLAAGDDGAPEEVAEVLSGLASAGTRLRGAAAARRQELIAAAVGLTGPAESSPVSEPPPSRLELRVGNTAAPVGDRWNWTCYVQPAPGVQADIERVTFKLHPTFRNNVVEVSAAPFECRATGWGTFKVQILVDVRAPAWDKAVQYAVAHELSFDEEDCGAVRTARRVRE